MVLKRGGLQAHIGDLDAHHTLIAPPSQYHEFQDGEWIITETAQAEKERIEAEESKLQELIAESQELYRALNEVDVEAEIEDEVDAETEESKE